MKTPSASGAPQVSSTPPRHIERELTGGEQGLVRERGPGPVPAAGSGEAPAHIAAATAHGAGWAGGGAGMPVCRCLLRECGRALCLGPWPYLGLNLPTGSSNRPQADLLAVGDVQSDDDADGSHTRVPAAACCSEQRTDYRQPLYHAMISSEGVSCPELSGANLWLIHAADCSAQLKTVPLCVSQ